MARHVQGTQRVHQTMSRLPTQQVSNSGKKACYKLYHLQKKFVKNSPWTLLCISQIPFAIPSLGSSLAVSLCIVTSLPFPPDLRPQILQTDFLWRFSHFMEFPKLSYPTEIPFSLVPSKEPYSKHKEQNLSLVQLTTLRQTYKQKWLIDALKLTFVTL